MPDRANKPSLGRQALDHLLYAILLPLAIPAAIIGLAAALTR